jgi:phosphate transport system ATP-binding protein
VVVSAAVETTDVIVRPAGEIRLETRDLQMHYGAFHALKDISMAVPARQITALIGPSGCGKSSFLRCFNRMNDVIDGVCVAGDVLLDGEDIYRPGLDVAQLRKRVGMVFQAPNPFPMSIYDNIAYGPRLHGTPGRGELDRGREPAGRRPVG